MSPTSRGNINRVLPENRSGVEMNFMDGKIELRIVPSMIPGKIPRVVLKITRPAEPMSIKRKPYIPDDLICIDNGTQKLIDDLFPHNNANL